MARDYTYDDAQYVSVATDAAKDRIIEQALADENVLRFVDGKEIRKVIVVPGRLVSIVV